MKKKDIEKLQEQIDQDERQKSKPAEKKLKINKTLDESVLELIIKYVLSQR